MSSIEQDSDFQRFCDSLEVLKGTTPLHKPSEQLLQKILLNLPELAAPKPLVRPLMRWWFPFSLGALAAATAVLLIQTVPDAFLTGKISRPQAFARLSPEVFERAQTSRLISLWKQQGLSSAWWKPVLWEARKRHRIPDVLSLCVAVQAERMSNKRLMMVLERDLGTRQSPEAIMAEMRTLTATAAKQTSPYRAQTLEADLTPDAKQELHVNK